MMTQRIILLWLLLLTACGPAQTDPALEAANQLHLEAVAISDTLEDYLVGAEGARWDSLRTAYAQWEASLVEVPGFEHAHEHDHGHRHDHHHDLPLDDLSPAEIQELQQALWEEVAKMLGLARQWDEAASPIDTLTP